MKMRKLAQVAGAVSDIAKSDNPAAAAGNLAAGAAVVAHPILGTMAAPLIKKGVSAAVQKGIDTAKDPEVQAKAKEIGAEVHTKAKEVGGEVAKRGRTAMRGLTSRAGELRAGLGK
jgi:hypothetical protein